MKFICGVVLAALSLFLTCSPDSSAELPADTDIIMDGKKFLALGDSYTIGESVNAVDRWPHQLVNVINTSDSVSFQLPRIIARTGWRTDELKKAIISADLEEPYDLVSLLIGVNNQYQGIDIEVYRTEFRELLETAIAKAGGINANVLVLSIPDYGYTPFGEKDKDRISAELDEYNSINRTISEEYEVMYVNITDISRSTDPVLVAQDGLHPSEIQYEEWVNRILSTSSFKAYLAAQAP